MKLYQTILFTLLLLLKTATSDAAFYYNRPDKVKILSTVTAIPMNQISSKHYCIEVYIDNQGPFKFMVDTGASLSIISQQLADKLHLQLVKKVNFSRDNTQYKGGLYRIDKLTLANAELYHYDVMVYPEPTFISYLKDGFHEHIDGILGIGAFYDYLLTLDFQKNLMTLENRNLIQQSKNVSVFDNSEKIPIVTVLFSDQKNRQAMRFVVDSGSNEAFTLAPAIISLPFNKIKSEHIPQGSHYGEYIVVKEKLAANAYWGDKALKEPSVVYNKALYDANVSFGLMGILVMEHFKITIDQRKNLIEVE